MKKYENLKLLAFVGLPGAGVSTAVKYLGEKQYPAVRFGTVVLEAMKAAGAEDTAENEQTFRENLRTEKGPEAIVNQIIPEIHGIAGAGQHRIVIDGLYAWSEYKALKHEFPGELITVGIMTQKVLRHRRLVNRLEKPMTDADASARDWEEIEKLEKGGPIAIADYYISNSGSREELQSRIDDLLRRIEF